MKIHILGICGTFMGGVALLAREAGFTVAGSDANVYPPMSTQLETQGITLHEGYRPEHLAPAPDQVVVGNALSRGNPAVEYLLDQGIAYTSGPQWLAERILAGRWVLAVAGTHGKTSTACMLAWILDSAGLKPGFLVGGVPRNFGLSARLGRGELFVVEADEYDTAFFDKRSKFVHYRPRTLVLNNLEYDHADIFSDLAAIQRQFHHLIRTVPGNGLILHNQDDARLAETLAMGCWTPLQGVSVSAATAQWQSRLLEPDGSRFEVLLEGRPAGVVSWEQLGDHNVHNALSAIAAAHHAGVPVASACTALGSFLGVKRRLEVRAVLAGVTVYDDFAHHPTAIASTLGAVRGRVGNGRILLLLEPRSNTMRMGVHRHTLAASFAAADRVWLHMPSGLGWDLSAVADESPVPAGVCPTVDAIIEEVSGEARAGDHILIMSNGSFDGIHDRLIRRLEVLGEERSASS
jgi:UDP-N-acetylmuramate: L-alanyl-gamma-D-glutamyl-meso-diaminopimelate ligase